MGKQRQPGGFCVALHENMAQVKSITVCLRAFLNLRTWRGASYWLPAHRLESLVD